MANEHERQWVPCGEQSLVVAPAQSYYAEISSQFLAAHSEIIERVIEFVFGDLEARHLELRVVEARGCGGTTAATERFN